MLNLTRSDVITMIRNNEGNIKEVIDLINISKCLADDEEESIIEILEEVEIEARICSNCKKIILRGYCIYDGEEYACSDSCLHFFMTDEEFEEAYNDGNGTTFETEWTELDNEGNAIGVNIRIVI